MECLIAGKQRKQDPCNHYEGAGEVQRMAETSANYPFFLLVQKELSRLTYSRSEPVAHRAWTGVCLHWSVGSVVCRLMLVPNYDGNLFDTLEMADSCEALESLKGRRIESRASGKRLHIEHLRVREKWGHHSKKANLQGFRSASDLTTKNTSLGRINKI